MERGRCLAVQIGLGVLGALITAAGVGLQIAAMVVGFSDSRNMAFFGWGIGLMMGGIVLCSSMCAWCSENCEDEEKLRQVEAGQERQRLMDEAQALRDKRAMERGYEEGLRKGKEDAIAVLTARRLT